jgi:hypothetical protein
MGIASFLCIGIGVYPDPLYRLLPFRVEYAPYTPSHVITQLQLLIFSALAFAVLKRTGIYPLELKSTNLDSDWFYRHLPRVIWEMLCRPVVTRLDQDRQWLAGRVSGVVFDVPKRWGISQMVLLIVFLLFSFLVINFSYN